LDFYWERVLEYLRRRKRGMSAPQALQIKKQIDLYVLYAHQVPEGLSGGDHSIEIRSDFQIDFELAAFCESFDVFTGAL
jgi:hypothetical protein